MTADLPVKDFDHLLEETLGLGLQIESIDWRPLTQPGENYGSVIYSVNASVRRKNGTEILNLVVKAPPPTAYLADLFNSPISFWKELVFYRDIAPKFLQLQLENSVNEDDLVNLVPRYYGGRLGFEDEKVFDSQAAIVMENLVPKGYAIRDRLEGFDLKHAELTVRELAKFHAIVIGLKIKMPQFFKDIVMPALVYAENEERQTGVRSMVRIAHNVLKDLPEAKKYFDRIEKTLKYDYEVDCRTVKSSEPWATMVHSDLWCNNMLFKYDDQKRPIQMKVVDFQLGIYRSGAVDLIFFLMSSVQIAVIDESLDDLLSLYYEAFIDFLTLLKVDTEQFTLEEYYKQINECAPLKLGQCMMMANFINADKEAVNDLNNPNDGAAAPGFGARAIEKLLHTLQIYDKKHWLVD